MEWPFLKIEAKNLVVSIDVLILYQNLSVFVGHEMVDDVLRLCNDTF